MSQPATDGAGMLALAAVLMTAGGPVRGFDAAMTGMRTLLAMGYCIPHPEFRGWGLAVRGFRARGVLIDDYHSDTWTAAPELLQVYEPPAEWLDAARAAWAAQRHNVKVSG